MADRAPLPPSEDVGLRDVTEEDLPILFEHQREPEANRMAAFPARDREAFMAHWRTKVLGDETAAKKAIVVEGRLAGNIGSWGAAAERQVGYWIGKEFWGRGIATKALSKFLGYEKVRPLFAHVAVHNVASIRVLEKCGFTVVGAPSLADDGVEELVLKLEA